MIKKKGMLLAVVLTVALALVGYADKWEYVATVVSDASKDESELLVDSGQSIVVDRPLLIELRDGTLRQTYGVRHVYGSHVLLKERLKRDFLAGSKVYQ